MVGITVLVDVIYRKLLQLSGSAPEVNRINQHELLASQNSKQEVPSADVDDLQSSCPVQFLLKNGN
jgi:hypothetical protein